MHGLRIRVLGIGLLVLPADIHVPGDRLRITGRSSAAGDGLRIYGRRIRVLGIGLLVLLITR